MMKAIVRYLDPKKGFECKEIPIPKVVPRHVLVKMQASPINHIDALMLSGFNKFPMGVKEPICCGTEGAGTVVEIGPDVPPELMGKKVAIERYLKLTPESVGVWCQYALVHYEACIVVDDSFDFKEISGLCGNPLTSLGLLEVIRTEGCKSAVFTAAASALGKNMLGISLKEGIDMICVVRKKENEDLLKSLGAKYVLNSMDPDFDKALGEICTKLGTRLCYDCVGGSMLGRILAVMPEKTTAYVYGGLDGPVVNGINTMGLIMKKQTIKGYQLGDSGFLFDPEKLKLKFEYIVGDMRKGGKAFVTHVAKTAKLEECAKALQEFKAVSSKGKVVFLPND